MLKLEYSREAVEALRYWRFHHPHPLVQLKMEVVLLRSQGVLHEQMQPICGISKATLSRYLHEYQAGGVERLKEVHWNCQESALVHQRTTLEEHFRAQPPATVAAAAAQIEALTGITRSLTQTRQFLQKSLNLSDFVEDRSWLHRCPRRHRRYPPICTRLARNRRGDAQRLLQCLCATNYDKLSDS